ncbi:MAG: VWA domain-containing protein [Gammaproteobacteria bacterium]|nr:VWA domain-containing protein [Gammaproteobacteria bacterium]
MPALLLVCSSLALAQTELRYEDEPNDSPAQATSIVLPDAKRRLSVLGELSEDDQDAFRFTIDADDAGKRWNFQLSGSGAALTKADLFDFSQFLDGGQRIPGELTERPDRVWTLTTGKAARPARADGLLLAPGTYVLGFSHSEGEGAYRLDVTVHDHPPLTVIGEDNHAGAPQSLSLRRPQAIWIEREGWFEFQAGDGAFHDLTVQSPAGGAFEAELRSADGDRLLAWEGTGGQPVTRHGLALEPGNYGLVIRTSAPGTLIVAMEPSAATTDAGRETEPNDHAPNRIDAGQSVAGTFESRDVDLLAVSVTAEETGQLYDLHLEMDGEGGEAQLCLLHEATALKHCRRAAGSITLHQLGLAEGDYSLELIPRGTSPVNWELTWRDAGPVRPGAEMEPNDQPEQAVPLAERGFGRGRFHGDRETDYWRIQVTGEPRLWRVQLQGDGLHDLALENAGGQTLAAARAGNRPRIRLDNVYLMPGEYFIAARGTESDYIVRLLDLGPPPPGMEREPNDSFADAIRLRFDQDYFGTLAQDGDVDVYRFTLLGHEHIALSVQPPVDGGIRGQLRAGDDGALISDIRHGRNPGTPLDWDLLLPPGDYSLELSTGTVSDAEYDLRLDRLEWFDAPIDREPNNNRDTAAPLPVDGRIAGRVGQTAAAEDWYRLGPMDTAQAIELPVQRGLRVTLHGESDDDLLVRDGDIVRADLAAGQNYWLRVRGDGEYSFDLAAADSPAAGSEPLELSMVLDTETVQAFSPWQQHVAGHVTLRNPSSEARQVQLDSHLTDVRWTLHNLPRQVTVAGGASRKLDFAVEVPPDAVPDPPVRLTIRGRDKHGDGRTERAIVADASAMTVDPVFHWSIPAALRGGINVARAAFGAEPVSSPNIDDRDLEKMGRLFDGLINVGHWAGYTIPTQGRQQAAFGQPTVHLAGSGTIPVRGFVLDPTAALTPVETPRDFALELSTDGQTFTEVFRGTLQPTPVEQSFVLAAAVPASHARLVLLNATLGDAGSISGPRLGEFKVIAEPGWEGMPTPVNLADPEFGGHLVWADPWLRGSTFDRSLLVAGQATQMPRLSGADEFRIVLGFHESRAARISGLSIEFAEAAQPLPAAVGVEVGVDGPAGPWRQLGRFDLDPEATAIELPEMPWARYVSLRFAVPDDSGRLQLPDQIRVFEAVADGYLSVLGEWGRHKTSGPREAEDEPRPPRPAQELANTSRGSALLLQNGEPAAGRALLDEYSAWYRIDVPAGRNRLHLSARGAPTLEAVPRLLDDSGDAVTLSAGQRTAEQQEWQAFVQPGHSYHLEMLEPPRSVIFSWDSSGSVSRFLPFISNALYSYAEAVRPGRDEINLVPFGSTQPLLDDWLGHPYPLQKLLSAYPHDATSSAAEQALAVSSRALQGRPGKKAVILVTDAETSTDEDLWPALHAARPQVFAMGLSSDGSRGAHTYGERDLMQDWAQVRGGHYDFVTGLNGLEQGFDRAVAAIRRPVEFEVSATFDHVENPAPASISVVGADADGQQPAPGAVEIILDASGSMLKRMDGVRRIEVAKAAVVRTVEDTLPAGVPLALRVYGHREAGVCRTDLEIPLQPLDKAAFLQRVEGIQAINLARTPIAESLAAVADDLREAGGRKLVVLLTDGEETCGGDPGAAIARLQEGGLNVRVNIVGFALDDDSIRAQFRHWARQGGGEYHDADDVPGLQLALNRALETPFRVFDPAGMEVARGVVGGAAEEVPPGLYEVHIESAAGLVRREVVLAPAEQRTLRVTGSH